MTSPRRQTTNNYSSQDRAARRADVVTIQTQNQSQPSDSQPQASAERIGDILRRVRLKRGDDLGHIAEYLCIRRSYLTAIEQSDYDKFPADAYVIGFLRSYAELMGLEGKEAINLYRAEMAGRRKKPALSMPTPMPEGRSPSVFILIGALVTAILVYALWYGISSSDRAAVSVPSLSPVGSITVPAPLPSSASVPATETMSTSPAPTVPLVPVTETPPAAAAPAPSAVAPAVEPSITTPPTKRAAETTPAPIVGKSPRLIIKAEQSSWVMVSDAQGQTIFDRVMKPGEIYKVPDGAGYALTTGNGGGLLLSLDGVDLPKLSSAAASSTGVMRNIPLDAAHLKVITQAR